MNKDKYLKTKRALFSKLYSNLNGMQQQAVFNVNGPLLVLAGAGSGKLLGPQQTEQVAHQLHNGRKKALARIAHHQNDPCCRAYDIKKK